MGTLMIREHNFSTSFWAVYLSINCRCRSDERSISTTRSKRVAVSRKKSRLKNYMEFRGHLG